MIHYYYYFICLNGVTCHNLTCDTSYITCQIVTCDQHAYTKGGVIGEPWVPLPRCTWF